MGRILSRDCAFKMIYQYLFSKDSNAEIVCEENSLSDLDKAFALDLFNKSKDNFEEIENKILENLKNNLKISDLYKLDLAILICAIAEIDYLNESKSLAINEAVEMAKKYSTDNSPKFVNGVLSSIYNKK